MNRLSLLAILGVFALANIARAQDNKSPADSLKTTKQKASYGIGLSIGANLKGNGLGADVIDISALFQGLQDALADRKAAFSDKELETVMTAFQKELTENAVKKGLDFLAANRKKPGVKTLESGLQYEVLKAGKGPSPKANDTVTTHYHGTLIDGTVFDSSVERGEPASFGVSQVIRGWTEALQLMKVGGKWRLVLPSELAYGKRGAGGKIGPDTVLVFEVELIGIKKAPEKLSK